MTHTLLFSPPKPLLVFFFDYSNTEATCAARVQSVLPLRAVHPPFAACPLCERRGCTGGLCPRTCSRGSTTLSGATHPQTKAVWRLAPFTRLSLSVLNTIPSVCSCTPYALLVSSCIHPPLYIQLAIPRCRLISSRSRAHTNNKRKGGIQKPPLVPCCCVAQEGAGLPPSFATQAAGPTSLGHIIASASPLLPPTLPFEILSDAAMTPQYDLSLPTNTLNSFTCADQHS